MLKRTDMNDIQLSKIHVLMDYEQLCKKILGLNKQIRFAAVYNSDIEKIAGGMRKGIETITPESITKLSVEQSFIRRDTRIRMREWIGLPKYALAEYEKIKRFTFYLEDDKLLLVSTELALDISSFVTAVSKLI